jgi:drug/metabolite transporter (DMT)-like permease
MFGLGLGIGGAAVLGIKPDSSWSFGYGDTLTFISAIIFAVQILTLDHLGRGVRSTHITVGFLGTTGGLALLASIYLFLVPGSVADYWHWLGRMFSDWEIILEFAVLTIFPTVLAFHWMNAFQPRVSAGRAALIYLLEPVFGSMFSVVWGHDPVTTALLLGGALILVGNAIAEMKRG